MLDFQIAKYRVEILLLLLKILYLLGSLLNFIHICHAGTVNGMRLFFFVEMSLGEMNRRLIVLQRFFLIGI